jgi:hypothetical protein
VPRSWIDVSALVPTIGSRGARLPDVVWMDAADMRSIYGAGGQHRFKALEIFREKLERQRVKLTKEHTTYTARKSSKADVDDDVLARLASELQTVNGELANLGKWALAIYDYGPSYFPLHLFYRLN